MGTREVYEEKLRSGNLHHDPTINPGLGSPRCPRCLSLLNPDSKSGEWTITPVLHDATAVAGSGIGGLLSAIHGFNTGIPYVQNHVKGPKWLPFVVGLPPLLLYAAASSAFGVDELNIWGQHNIEYRTTGGNHLAVGKKGNRRITSLLLKQLGMQLILCKGLQWTHPFTKRGCMYT
ncbi:hypothetical protein L1049_008385 [Liquidambar formosana]|uniref:Uncharacterized protein n=1 Tax=Liquidambar formosana TaxID=63359 RepID=A0AAP0S648_LIQFO